MARSVPWSFARHSRDAASCPGSLARRIAGAGETAERISRAQIETARDMVLSAVLTSGTVVDVVRRG